jgi:hypothetical protein
MHEDAKGTTLLQQHLMVSTTALSALELSLGSPSAPGTARLVPYFAATIGGESTAVDGLGLDLSRALLAGLEYEWRRPFLAEEEVQVRVVVDDVYMKGTNQFGVISAEFTGADGALVQRQKVTFIERGSE